MKTEKIVFVRGVWRNRKTAHLYGGEERGAGGGGRGEGGGGRLGLVNSLSLFSLYLLRAPFFRGRVGLRFKATSVPCETYQV